MRSNQNCLAAAVLLAFVLQPAPLTAQDAADSPGKPAVAQTPVRYIEKEMLVPILNATPNGLDVVEIYADTPGRHPLAILTHGTSVKPEERRRVTPWAQYNQALWFARRGYVVLIVVRKGYGRSGGVQDGHAGGCSGQGGFHDPGVASAEDLTSVIRKALVLPEVDPETIISAGISTGGFAQVALVADPPKGLKAAISFAGGRGSDGKEHNCDLGALVHAFQSFGKEAAKHGPTPMLWIYSENDHFFPPVMARQFDDAYRKGGGNDEFVMAPPNGEDGHNLYNHPADWTDTVAAFLKAHGLLPLGETVLPPPTPPELPAPPGLHDRGLEAWKRFEGAPPFKAFANSGNGFWGLIGGQFDQAQADEEALNRCRKAAGGSANDCKVVAKTPGMK